MTKRPLSTPSLLRRTKNAVHTVQRRLNRRLFRGPGRGMKTDVMAHAKPVIFMHNPRTGGRSLEKFLNVQKLSHTYPSERLDESHWLENFVVTSVRHPMDRFFSGYFGTCRTEWQGALVKRYGLGIHDLNPAEYLEVIKKHPRHIGPQRQWTDYPSATKPRADLVLRLEDVAQWEEQMRAAGLDIGSRTLPHVGKSKNAPKREPQDLGLSTAGYADLVRDVEAYFAEDYEAFGYQTGTSI